MHTKEIKIINCLTLQGLCCILKLQTQKENHSRLPSEVVKNLYYEHIHDDNPAKSEIMGTGFVFPKFILLLYHKEHTYQGFKLI